jgi:hypothetical protein
MAELIRPAVEGVLDQIDRRIDRRIETALRPLTARIEALERQVAELGDDPAPDATLQPEKTDPAL